MYVSDRTREGYTGLAYGYFIFSIWYDLSNSQMMRRWWMHTQNINKWNKYDLFASLFNNTFGEFSLGSSYFIRAMYYVGT